MKVRSWEFGVKGKQID